MIHDNLKVDDIDQVCLITALMQSNELESRLPEGEIYRVGVAELGEFLSASHIALNWVVTQTTEDPENWDGVVWFERLSDPSEGSLADRLVELLIDHEADEDNVLAVVIDWLRAEGL